MQTHYTDEQNALVLITLLKAHGIRRVVASPGSTNVCFVASIQQDPWFQIWSAPDERSAGYMACGMAAECGEPVVLSCTGATASRNYMPALTEAYYRKLPVLVVTSSRRSYLIGHNIAQITDRVHLPTDIAKLSVQMPMISDEPAKWFCTIQANKAILELNHRGTGPVHINLETDYSFHFPVKELPEVPVIRRCMPQNEFPQLPAGRIAVMVGSHPKFSPELTQTVEAFCRCNDAVVLCDHTSGYKGESRILANLPAVQSLFNATFRNVDLLIHIGDVSASDYHICAKQVWRVSPDGELRDTYRALRWVFEMEEQCFFRHYSQGGNKADSFRRCCEQEYRLIREKLEDQADALPFSNIFAARSLASKIPADAVLHLGIFNSLRSWNFFEIPAEVYGYSNTGGFGIDGCVSSAIGAALACPDRIVYCVVGDLAFFYDMNSLGNRHLPKNLRLLLINNGIGAEFKLPGNNGTLFGEDTNCYIAAAGHYGAKSPDLVRHYASDLGFDYQAASDKESFAVSAEWFTDPQMGDKPMLLEIFTKDSDEVEAQRQVMELHEDKVTALQHSVKDAAKRVLGDKGVAAFKKLLGR